MVDGHRGEHGRQREDPADGRSANVAQRLSYERAVGQGAAGHEQSERRENGRGDEEPARSEPLLAQQPRGDRQQQRYQQVERAPCPRGPADERVDNERREHRQRQHREDAVGQLSHFGGGAVGREQHMVVETPFDLDRAEDTGVDAERCLDGIAQGDPQQRVGRVGQEFFQAVHGYCGFRGVSGRGITRSLRRCVGGRLRTALRPLRPRR